MFETLAGLFEGLVDAGEGAFDLFQVLGGGVPVCRQAGEIRSDGVHTVCGQQLQGLRDLGLVEFLGGGQYRAV